MVLVERKRELISKAVAEYPLYFLTPTGQSKTLLTGAGNCTGGKGSFTDGRN